MTKYIFKPGERGQAHPSLPADYANKPFTIVEGLGMRRFQNHGDRLVESYLVKFDHEPTAMYPLSKVACLLTPPERGDMDVVVGWDMLPRAVEEATKGEKK